MYIQVLIIRNLSERFTHRLKVYKLYGWLGSRLESRICKHFHYTQDISTEQHYGKGNADIFSSEGGLPFCIQETVLLNQYPWQVNIISHSVYSVKIHQCRILTLWMKCKINMWFLNEISRLKWFESRGFLVFWFVARQRRRKKKSSSLHMLPSQV